MTHTSPPTTTPPDILKVGIELGYLTPAQAESASKRQQELRQGGIDLPVGQVLLERRILVSGQLKRLMRELAYRRAQHAKAPAAPTTLKKNFGPYELQEVLASSGRCRVISARDTAMGRQVVLKVLPPHVASNNVWLERFRREVQLAGQLSHPNIVTAYGTAEIEGSPVLVLEFVDGTSLDRKLEIEGNIAEKTVWLMAREVAKALACAAEKNILHRDIKPANILISKDGKVKICDMGLSKSMADDTALTAAGTTVGTPFYISPEQAHGTKDLDGRSDIYSLGCTVFHMLTGSVPFLGETLTDVMLAHTHAVRPDPRAFLPEITEGSSRLVMRMMATKPEERPQSAQTLVEEIDALLPLLPEPEPTIRPVAKVSPSDVPAGKSSAVRPAVTVDVPRPSLLTRFLDWLTRLFS
ncbi:MAG TPA: serine/threonine-protein kinase [Planctomycetota bacterium]|nr:serine/threonine-protein kinase [Planctomycetota bacterium]